ncbi:MAG TPA: hypothetical protein VF017_06910 [Thermoanaerobaculia bacterium]|nr:hypothetical protein [Thermoanaerobaculia bacterium]
MAKARMTERLLAAMAFATLAASAGCGRTYEAPADSEPHGTVMILDVAAGTTDLSVSVDGARVALGTFATSLSGSILMLEAREYQVPIDPGAHDLQVGQIGVEPGVGAMTFRTGTTDAQAVFAPGQVAYLVVAPTKVFAAKKVVAVSAADYERCRRLTQVDWSRELAARDANRLIQRVGECSVVVSALTGRP